MKKLGLIIIFLCAVVSVKAQTSDCPSPQGCILITREAALKALADADRVKALEAEVKIKDTAFDGQKALLNQMRIDFAAASGELTALKQNAVSDRAIIDILLKNVRPRKIGLIVF
tara:strand:- start:145 stop:489 length:345 start_codon:yes stop_codon:yes gene_type:complete